MLLLHAATVNNINLRSTVVNDKFDGFVENARVLKSNLV